MLPLFDMLANAQNGNGIDLLSRQFNLTRQQTELALEALLPAFCQGLKRNASDPYGIAGFMKALASGQHGQYFDDASRAFSPDGMADGNGILGHLFGSKDLSRAVAAQAAQATGIGQDMLKQMLPAIASMIMGGMFKQSTQQPDAGEPGAGRWFRRRQSARRDHRADDAARRRHGRRRNASAAAKRAADPVRQSVRQGAEGHVRRRRAGARRAAGARPRQMSRPTIRSARSSRRCSAAAAVRADPQPEPEPQAAPSRAPTRADGRKTPMTTSSATCSRPAARPATTTRRAWKRLRPVPQGHGQAALASGRCLSSVRLTSDVSFRTVIARPDGPCLTG